MLISIALQPYAKQVIFGDLQTLETILFDKALNKINYSDYADKRVVIKGCGNLPVPIHAYVLLAAELKPYAKSIMFGEPCSTVPLYKAPINK